MKGNEEFCKNLSYFAIKGLQLAKQPGVLLGGWAGLTRAALDTTTDEGKALHAWAEENVIELPSCPHDWLFPQCAAVVHHGGAGTLAAGIRAGCPTIVCATQGDQPFHGSIAQQHGIGKYVGMVGKIPPATLGRAIHEVTSSDAMKQAAMAMGEKVRAEDGLATSIAFLEEASTFKYPWPVHGTPISSTSVDVI